MKGKHAKHMRNCHCSKRFLTSAASVFAGTICIVPLILGSTVAQSQEAPMPGSGGETILAQRTETGRTIGAEKSQHKDPMSWKDILNKESHLRHLMTPPVGNFEFATRSSALASMAPGGVNSWSR
jgi:hypothetical protein